MSWCGEFFLGRWSFGEEGRGWQEERAFSLGTNDPVRHEHVYTVKEPRSDIGFSQCQGT